MDSELKALLGGETRKREVVEVDETRQQIARRIDLHRQPRLREVDLDLVRTL